MGCQVAEKGLVKVFLEFHMTMWKIATAVELPKKAVRNNYHISQLLCNLVWYIRPARI